MTGAARGRARRVASSAGKVGEPAQQRLLVGARQRREVGVARARRRLARSRCPPAAAPSTRARARTARSRPGLSSDCERARSMSNMNSRVGLARDEEEAHRVAADFVDQVAQRHVAARALADLHLLAAAHHRHHLVQHVVRDSPAGMPMPERLQAGAHARDRAVVIGALHVDDASRSRAPTSSRDRRRRARSTCTPPSDFRITRSLSSP